MMQIKAIGVLVVEIINMFRVVSCKLRVIITLCTIFGLYCNILYSANSLILTGNQLPPSWAYSQVCDLHTINPVVYKKSSVCTYNELRAGIHYANILAIWNVCIQTL